MGYYNYHAQIKKLLNCGNLIGIEPSDKAEFAFVFVFLTENGIIKKPVRPHAVYRYEEYLKNFKPKK
ncbi:hypothetical protein EOM82_04645 [bacterium]|nr:hypothetical protein [bacterium]